MTNITKLVLILTLSTTVGQCFDLPKDDQNLEITTKKLATRLNVAILYVKMKFIDEMHTIFLIMKKQKRS